MSSPLLSSPPSSPRADPYTELNSGLLHQPPSKKLEDAVKYKATPYVVLVCITAASGGLLFGYDSAISGGVSAMDGFLLKFFPEVYRKKSDARTDNYCKFDSQLLTLFTSSMYIAGLVASFVASRVTKDYGRRVSILTGGIFFFVGSILGGFAQNLAMLIIGRLILGFGLGFTNQVVPLYLSEMAPANLRGMLTTMFELAIVLGATSASLVNYGANEIKPWGWRMSLSLAVIPSLIITIGSAFLPDSPTSLIQRGDIRGGLVVLKRIRGSDDVSEEFNYLLEAKERVQAIENPWRNIIKRKYRPQLVMAFAIPVFQQATGIIIIVIYLPILVETLGFGTSDSLLFTLIFGLISLLVTSIGGFGFDKFGRRKLFLLGGSSMLLFLVLTGLLLQLKLKSHNKLSTTSGMMGLVFILGFKVCFALSLGPLAWLIPSEIFPLEIRSAGLSINTAIIMLLRSFSMQAFLALLCQMKATIFYFFGGWALVMTVYVYFLLPETKGLPLEEIANLWRRHPFWRRYYT